MRTREAARLSDQSLKAPCRSLYTAFLQDRKLSEKEIDELKDLLDRQKKRNEHAFDDPFQTIFNMSGSPVSSAPAVMIVRPKKAPAFSYALWAFVFIRLVMPVSFYQPPSAFCRLPILPFLKPDGCSCRGFDPKSRTHRFLSRLSHDEEKAVPPAQMTKKSRITPVIHNGNNCRLIANPLPQSDQTMVGTGIRAVRTMRLPRPHLPFRLC